MKTLAVAPRFTQDPLGEDLPGEVWDDPAGTVEAWVAQCLAMDALLAEEFARTSGPAFCWDEFNLREPNVEVEC